MKKHLWIGLIFCLPLFASDNSKGPVAILQPKSPPTFRKPIDPQVLLAYQKNLLIRDRQNVLTCIQNICSTINAGEGLWHPVLFELDLFSTIYSTQLEELKKEGLGSEDLKKLTTVNNHNDALLVTIIQNFTEMVRHDLDFYQQQFQKGNKDLKDITIEDEQQPNLDLIKHLYSLAIIENDADKAQQVIRHFVTLVKNLRTLSLFLFASTHQRVDFETIEAMSSALQKTFQEIDQQKEMKCRLVENHLQKDAHDLHTSLDLTLKKYSSKSAVYIDDLTATHRCITGDCENVTQANPVIQASMLFKDSTKKAIAHYLENLNKTRDALEKRSKKWQRDQLDHDKDCLNAPPFTLHPDGENHCFLDQQGQKGRVFPIVSPYNKTIRYSYVNSKGKLYSIGTCHHGIITFTQDKEVHGFDVSPEMVQEIDQELQKTYFLTHKPKDPSLLALDLYSVIEEKFLPQSFSTSQLAVLLQNQATNGKLRLQQKIDRHKK